MLVDSEEPVALDAEHDRIALGVRFTLAGRLSSDLDGVRETRSPGENLHETVAAAAVNDAPPVREPRLPQCLVLGARVEPRGLGVKDEARVAREAGEVARGIGCGRWRGSALGAGDELSRHGGDELVDDVARGDAGDLRVVVGG